MLLPDKTTENLVLTRGTFLFIILNDEGSLLYAQTAPTCLSRAVCFGKGSARPAAIASCEMP